MAPTSSPPPFRAEHIGSLLRPPSLLALRARLDARDAGVTREQIKAAEDEAVREAVQLQQRLGFRAVTDGEMGKRCFFDGFFENLTGIEVVQNPPEDWYVDWWPSVKAIRSVAPQYLWPIPVAKGKLRRERPIFRPQFERLASLVPPSDVPYIKINLAMPELYYLTASTHAWSPSAYAGADAYLSDVARCFAEELADLYDAGCRNVQMDVPQITFFCDLQMQADMAAAGVDGDELLGRVVRLYDDCIKHRPADMHVGLHLCRGNGPGGASFCEGSYERIAERLFNDISADTYYLEYDHPRCGPLTPLRHLPCGKRAVLGVVSSKDPALEDPAALEGKVREAAGFMGDGGMERLGVSTGCGFASVETGNGVTREEMEAKLALVVRTAERIWGTV